ncbi:MAG: crotonyl-CoA carboxylase/reductase, partial [Rhodospirillaceae bacterium]
MIALQWEIVPTPEPAAGEVVIMVMAAGVGMSTVWACLGIPTTPFVAGRRPYHVPGSDCAGVVWAVGAGVTGWQVGADVVVHPVVHDAADDDVAETSAQVWGYETPDGALAQFARVKAEQLLPRPSHLTWAESACYLSTLATAYRMLFGHPPHVARPGRTVLVWGAAQGLGAVAMQLLRVSGATVVGVVGGPEQVGVATRLGAHGVIDWSRFDCFRPLPDVEDLAAYGHWQRQTDAFITAACAPLGRRGNFDIVFEHPGQATFPLSCRLVRHDGMVVFCRGTTGYTFTFDARPAWMKEIRLQGSH